MARATEEMQAGRHARGDRGSHRGHQDGNPISRKAGTAAPRSTTWPGEFEKSIADCDEVLKRNPRHFGALSGMGQIYFQLEDWGKALEWYRRALEVNPNMLGVEMNIRMLEEKLQSSSSAWAIDVAASRGCSNGNRCPPRHLAQRELRPHPRQPTRRTTSESAPPMNAAGTRRLRQVAHHVVRDGAVDLVLDRRIDLQPQLAVLLDQAVAARSRRGTLR